MVIWEDILPKHVAQDRAYLNEHSSHGSKVGWQQTRMAENSHGRKLARVSTMRILCRATCLPCELRVMSIRRTNEPRQNGDQEACFLHPRTPKHITTQKNQTRIVFLFSIYTAIEDGALTTFLSQAYDAVPDFDVGHAV